MSATQTPTQTKLDERIVALCEAVLADEEVTKAQGKLETFLEDKDARELWQNFEELAMNLQQRQQKGEALAVADTDRYEELRSQLDGSPVVMGFLEARQILGGVQQKVSQYVGMTLEMGRVPTEDDLANTGGGCCGGSGEGSCGC